MMWFHPDNFEKKRANLNKRRVIIKAIRKWFDDQGFDEVETPVLQISPCMDAHIHGFATDLKDVTLNRLKTLYLHTSPEFDMKKLLVAGCENIYQICHVFRNGENTKRHSPEFTMLEYYRTGVDYEQLMSDCGDILCITAEACGVKEFTTGDKSCDPFLGCECISVTEALEKYAQIDLILVLHSRDDFAAILREKGLHVAEDDAWDDLFHRAMAEWIEPHLGMERPTILYDYPASMAALSRKKAADPHFAERFELYVCGVELANAFSELTDAAEQRARFEAEMAHKKERYGETYPIDGEFLAALEYGLPECAGLALGIDRLVMLACGAEDIEDVLWTRKP